MKKAKSKVVGKPAHHAKPAAPKKAKKHAAGAASKKHQPDAHQKHLAHLASEHTAHLAHLKHIGKAPAKKRGLALGDAVACCAAEALAASLRLAGDSVADRDVLTLHRLSGADDDAGGTILAALEAAGEYGLAGFRPVDYRPAECGRDLLGRRGEIGQAIDGFLECPAGYRQPARDYAPFPVIHAASVILGVELPGPHTVLATPDGWWSWGELYDPAGWPDAVIEEAWAVSWAC